MALYDRRDELPIPPKDAEIKNTVCQYCNVGCGYKVYVWPVGEMGGKKPNENAFGLDLTRPQPPLAGQSYTESMHATVVKKDGRNYHVVIVPARDSEINRGDWHPRAPQIPVAPRGGRLSGGLLGHRSKGALRGDQGGLR